MTVAEIVVLQFLCALALASISSYFGGRVHQRQREHDQRRTAFRAGFLRASVTFGAIAAGGERVTSRSTGSGSGTGPGLGTGFGTGFGTGPGSGSGSGSGSGTGPGAGRPAGEPPVKRARVFRGPW